MNPTRTSWWVVPGVLLAGPTPAVPDRDQTHKDLRKLLNAGIRVFFDLREHMEMLGGYRAIPYDAWLADMDASAKVVHHPMMDGSAPTPEQADRIVEQIVEQTRPTYVHCHGGHGRTGVIVACYLVKTQKLTAAEAIGKLKELRANSLPYLLTINSPQTPQQVDAVMAYEKWLRE